MTTMLRRLFWLALAAGAAYAAWSLWQRRTAPGPDAPRWPPLEPPTETAEPARSAAPPRGGSHSPAASTKGDTTGDEAPVWVEPVDGACPASHPIKANDNSGIYHVPGGRFYDRTGPERCYARAEDAEADGYRASKS